MITFLFLSLLIFSGTNTQPNLSPSLLQSGSNAATNQETFIQPILGVAPLGKTPLTKDQNQQLIILESAFKKLPHASDTERTRNYLPRVMINTPAYYPMAPPSGHDSIDFLNKLTSDSLFFMFYYMEGTKAQFLAAQALKKLSWRFHTRYMMWFQRFEEPKVITDEYEMVCVCLCLGSGCVDIHVCGHSSTICVQ
jgi:CCR4-NOT transcription complex subunit 3